MSLSTPWNRRVSSRCSAGCARRIAFTRPIRWRRLSGRSRSQCRTSYFSESRYSSLPGFARGALLQLEHRTVDAVVRAEPGGEQEARDERRPRALLQRLVEDVGCVGPHVGPEVVEVRGIAQLGKYSVSSHFSLRHVKYVYDCVKPSLASRSITRGRVNASARKMTSGSVVVHGRDQPLPERERLGVRVVDAEHAHAALDPEADDVEQRGPEARRGPRSSKSIG